MNFQDFSRPSGLGEVTTKVRLHMRIFVSIVFILLLGLITFHDANSSEVVLVGYDRAAAFGLNTQVDKVRTLDGAIFDVTHLKKSASALAQLNSISTAQGPELVGDEIKTYFYASSKTSNKMPINKKIPDIGF